MQSAAHANTAADKYAASADIHAVDDLDINYTSDDNSKPDEYANRYRFANYLPDDYAELDEYVNGRPDRDAFCDGDVYGNAAAAD